MKKRYLIGGGLLVACGMAFGNGGGYFRGGVERTGTVAGFEPEQTEKVRILDELLKIELGPESARVEVRYIMKNTGDSKARVRLGFPVEESQVDQTWMIPEQVAKLDRKHLSACRDYRLEAGGKAVKAVFEGEPWNKDHFEGIGGWLVSRVDFDGGEEKVVTIRFHCDYPLSESSVSDDSYSGARMFRYRLSTGACWAGTIGRGRVEVSMDGVDPAEVRVMKPAGRFRKEEGRWVWEFEDLEPTLADDIEIEAVPEVVLHSRPKKRGDYSENAEWVHYENRGGRWEIGHNNFRVKASSTLAADGENRYEAANLNDKDWMNAWAEGAAGPGIGEWLEIEPDVPQSLRAITIRPGYGKSEDLFRANARPKRIAVKLNDEFEFDAPVPDRMGNARIPVAGYSKPVKKVRLTFKEVYPGSRHEDLCVSDVLLRVGLAKKPNVHPAR